MIYFIKIKDVVKDKNRNCLQTSSKVILAFNWLSVKLVCNNFIQNEQKINIWLMLKVGFDYGRILFYKIESNCRNNEAKEWQKCMIKMT